MAPATSTEVAGELIIKARTWICNHEGCRHLGNTLRLWAVVFVANVVGALLFAVLMIKVGAVSPRNGRSPGPA